MSMQRLFVPALAIITLLVLACSGGVDTLSVAKGTSTEPTAAPDPVSQALAAATDLGLGDLDLDGMTGLLEELLASSEMTGFTDCLSSSMSLEDLMELAESGSTDADVEQIFPCLDSDELESIASSALSELDFNILEEIDLDGLVELIDAPELADCLTDSVGLSTLMELAASDPTDADIEPILSCFSGDLLDSFSGITVTP